MPNMPVAHPMPPQITRDRGCGRRVAGGLYWETQIGRDGVSFIVDAPVPIDVAGVGLAAIGQKFIQRNGVWHVLDWIGEEHYPNVADFIEEARILGVSRRMSAMSAGSTGHLQHLTVESRLLCVHRKAWIEAVPTSMPGAERMRCPLLRREHQASALRGTRGWMCAGLWWYDVTGTQVREYVAEQTPASAVRTITRTLPCGHSYVALGTTSATIPTRQYKAAIFASFPLTRLALVNDPVGHRHEPVMARLHSSHRPFSLVEA